MADCVSHAQRSTTRQCHVDITLGVFNRLRVIGGAPDLPAHIQHPGYARGAVLVDEIGVVPGDSAVQDCDRDAFAGDAVPMHLLTQEAFSLFTKHLSDTGMMAVHVSSNWIDLVPAIYAWADAERWEALTISTRGNADGVSGNPAVWVLLFRDMPTYRILAEECRPLMAEGKIMVQNLRNVTYGDLRPFSIYALPEFSR